PAPPSAPRRGADARPPPPGARRRALSDRRAGRLHERRQVDAHERAHPRRRAGRGSPLRDARPDRPPAPAPRRSHGPHGGHGRVHPQAAAPARAGLQEYARGGARSGPPPPPGRCRASRLARGRGVLPGRDGDGDGARATQGRGPAAQAPARGGRAAVLKVLTVPNLLTLLRIVAIPIFLIFLEDLRYREALGIFVAAGLTDGLDGAIARLTRTKTTFGAYLDPAADKLLLVSAFIALGFMHEVPRWLVVLVISRDVIIVLGFFLLFLVTRETMEVQPSVGGKLSTFLQLASVAIVLFSHTRP